MSEPKLISPLLDNFAIGESISEHHGVRCFPAMKQDSDEKYIVKIISVPASQSQLSALLLSGAYPDPESANAYFKELADNITSEIITLGQLSEAEGFLPYLGYQIVPMDDGVGYDIYLLSKYCCTLSRFMRHTPMTQLSALNLALDLCARLSICRRAGYLYAGLKPTNIFVTDENEYLIGDLGFIRLDSLHYASLPDRCRSVYTPPEIADAFSKLNTTIDIYAVGLMLYQIFNGGNLPNQSDLPAPEYADEEMSEIILKAIALDPQARWQDPTQMGKALVHYMQTKPISDLPITPLLADEPAFIADDSQTQGRFRKDDVLHQDISQNELSDDIQEDPAVYQEDDYGNLTFLEGISGEDILQEQESFLFDYDKVSDEVSEILTQADTLAALSVPDRAIAPEAVEIAMPQLPVQDGISIEDPSEDDSFQIQLNTDEDDEEEIAIVINDDVYESAPEVPAPKKKHSNRIWIIIGSILLTLVLLIGMIHLYANFYLQNIDSLTTEGGADGLIVYVDTKADETYLKVVCSDDYGNRFTASVTDGKAIFHNLIGNTTYTIKVQANGFHKLTGETTATYKTPSQTDVVQFNAVTGDTDGSVILHFAINGKDASGWHVAYFADDEPIQTAPFNSKVVTLTGLTVGKEYTFTLVPDSQLHLTGTTQIFFTPSNLIYAQNLKITSCMDNKLVAKWLAPEGAAVSNWIVRCTNGSDYDKTIVTSETTALFDDVTCSDSFTVEVKASNMSVSERVYISENAITVYDFSAQMLESKTLSLSWQTSADVPSSGWVLQYAISGTDYVLNANCSANIANLSPVLPGFTYTFTLLTSDGTSLLSEPLSFTIPEATDFSGTFGGLTVSREDMTARMCKTPSVKNWTYQNVKDEDFTTVFTSKQKASFLIKLNTSYGSDSTPIDVLFVLKKSDGTLINNSVKTYSWSSLWSKYYCELDLPNMPTESGEYNICIYFNGQTVVNQNFTISA